MLLDPLVRSGGGGGSVVRSLGEVWGGGGECC